MFQKHSAVYLVLLAIAGGLVITSTQAFSAQRVELSREFVPAFPFATLSAENPSLLAAHVAPPLGLGPNNSLFLRRESGAGTPFQNLHYEQMFQNVPVWGERIIVSRDRLTNAIQRLGGAVLRGIAADIPNLKPEISSGAALEKAKNVIRLGSGPGVTTAPSNPVFSDERSRLVVYNRPTDQVAKLSYEVTFFAVRKETGEPTRPVFIIDALTGETLFSYEALTFADGTGPGGNERTTEYFYGPGKQFPSFLVTEVGNGQCSLSNVLVETEDLNNGIDDVGVPFKYPCFNNTKKTINGGYAPMNDAFYFGALIHKMWTDWYDEPPISQKLVMRVHYSNGYEQAYWNGRGIYVGDGMTTFYPLVGLDMLGHEIAHGYTEQHSDLVNYNQSGGINEAFSDMAGEAAEYYNNIMMNHTNPKDPDFMIGETIMKQRPALRNMCSPTDDGRSIASAKDYYDDMPVHHSSGVYNKAFCTLAKRAGWDTRKAFHVFQVANRDFWTPKTNFQNGAEGVRDAAKNLGYPVGDVIGAFAAVDIVISP
jgi:Zn-dependent metalloprotease